MFFAIIWKNKQISLAELELIRPTKLKEITNILFTFDTDFPKLLNKLWGIIKRWEVIEHEQLAQELEWKKIIWTKDKDFWIKLKRQFNIKRFKLVDRIKTDLDVKNKWIEVIKFQDKIWIVRWYQNIKLYEKIDFDKPSRSMKMWMMPAKLTHIMLNIWLQNYLFNGSNQFYKLDNLYKLLTIFDPFAWSGTSGFLANYLWYDFIWSDLDITHLEKNKIRRDKQSEKNNKSFEIFQHDISESLPKEKINWNILIVSEWRLWTIVTDKTPKNDIIKYQKKVLELYKQFISTISEIKEKNNVKAIFTIPYYINQNNFLEEEISDFSQKKWRNFWSIKDIYSREKQKVARKIIILK